MSKVCPSCGGTAYTTVYPERMIAFQKDRICEACGTRYSLPTPRWAGVVFVLLGLLSLNIVFAIVMAQFEGNGWLAFRKMWGVVVPLVVIGLFMIVHGIRVWIRPGKL
jgi:hypothetical protein